SGRVSTTRSPTSAAFSEFRRPGRWAPPPSAPDPADPAAPAAGAAGPSLALTGGIAQDVPYPAGRMRRHVGEANLNATAAGCLGRVAQRVDAGQVDPAEPVQVDFHDVDVLVGRQ